MENFNECSILFFIYSGENIHIFPCCYYLLKIASSLHCNKNPIFSCIPRNETAQPRSQFLHVCICVFIYLFPRSVCLFGCSKIWADQSWEYIKRSKKHEFWNWETEHCNSVLKCINRNQTFILDSHRPIICSVVSSLRFTTANHRPLKMGSTNDDILDYLRFQDKNPSTQKLATGMGKHTHICHICSFTI